MKNKVLVLIGATATLALTSFAQMGGGGSGTNDMGMTNHTGGMWWTNISMMMTSMVSQTWTQHHQVVGPNTQHNPSMPAHSGQMTMPADMQTMIQKFQADRQQFMAQQKALQLQMKDATEQQRQMLLDQMHDQMQQWQAQQAQVRQQMSQQMEQMKQQMQDHQRLINQAGGTGCHPAAANLAVPPA